MSGEIIAFVLLSAASVIGALAMLYVSKVVHMLLSLVLTFFSLAGIYVLLSAEFVAVVQVLIYSGAISIMMIFGIMLTKHHDQEKHPQNIGRSLLAGGGVIVFFAAVYGAIRKVPFGEQATGLHEANTEQIGIKIFSYYVIPFEVVSVILLAALVGAVVLAKREGDDQS
ncbi:MAG: NADH-quinone oxidoreductase subunit J [Bacillaceae bacterium]|nr:NADH-quinone oxidoreductase subunit J [Bacillaceae bacterium]